MSEEIKKEDVQIHTDSSEAQKRHELIKLSKEYLRYKREIDALTKSQKELKEKLAEVLDGTKECSLDTGVSSIFVELKSVAGRVTADIDKLKADGLFDKYKKVGAITSRLTIKETKKI